jgi:hypothetical protein
MFGKVIFKSDSIRECVFIGESKISVMNEEVNMPALLKSRIGASKPWLPTPCTHYARTMACFDQHDCGYKTISSFYSNAAVDRRPHFGRVARPTAPEAPGQ